jgi:hypothetical protein
VDNYISNNQVIQSFIRASFKPVVTDVNVINDPFNQAYKLRLLLSNGEILSITINESKNYIYKPKQLFDEVYHHLCNEHPELLL